MQPAEIPSLINNIFLRLDKLETSVEIMNAKEKDLRTIVVDGFARMDAKFVELEEQIDFLAIELNKTNRRLDERFEKMEIKLDKILVALAID